MKVTRSGIIATNIGMMLLGGFLAILPAWGICRLWPEMTLPVFFSAILSWMMAGITVILRDRGKRQIESAPWSMGRKYVTFSLLNFILSALATIFLGAVLVAVIAGLVGLRWPQIRWPLFLALLIAWLAAGIGATVKRYRRRQGRIPIL